MRTGVPASQLCPSGCAGPGDCRPRSEGPRVLSGGRTALSVPERAPGIEGPGTPTSGQRPGVRGAFAPPAVPVAQGHCPEAVGCSLRGEERQDSGGRGRRGAALAALLPPARICRAERSAPTAPGRGLSGVRGLCPAPPEPRVLSPRRREGAGMCCSATVHQGTRGSRPWHALGWHLLGPSIVSPCAVSVSRWVGTLLTEVAKKSSLRILQDHSNYKRVIET